MTALKKEIVLDKENVIGGICIIILSILASFAAVIPNSELEIIWLSRIIHILSYLSLLYLLIGAVKKKQIVFYEFYFLISVFFYSSFSIFHCSNDFVFTNYYNILILFAIVLSSSRKKLLAYLYFKRLLLIISICVIICYFSYIFRLGLPYRIVSFYEESTISTVYADYRISYLLTNESILFVRACGLFNEPGFLGTICALVLIIENFDLSKWENGLIFGAGCLTFSFAFVILLIVGFVIKNGVRGVIPLLTASIMLAFVLYSLSNIEISNESFSYLLSRFDFSADVFGGDDRGNYLLDSFFEKQQNSFEDLMVGFGNGCVRGSTWKIYIVEHGLLGTALILSPLLIGSLLQAKYDKRSLCFVLCFFLSIYQRPLIFNALYFMILLGGMCYIKDTNKYLLRVPLTTDEKNK